MSPEQGETMRPFLKPVILSVATLALLLCTARTALADEQGGALVARSQLDRSLTPLHALVESFFQDAAMVGEGEDGAAFFAKFCEYYWINPAWVSAQRELVAIGPALLHEFDERAQNASGSEQLLQELFSWRAAEIGRQVSQIYEAFRSEGMRATFSSFLFAIEDRHRKGVTIASNGENDTFDDVISLEEAFWRGARSVLPTEAENAENNYKRRRNESALPEASQ